MGRRGHDRTVGVHSRAAEVEAAHWLAAGGAWPSALPMPGARLPMRLDMAMRPVGFLDLKRPSPNLGDISFSLFFPS